MRAIRLPITKVCMKVDVAADIDARRTISPVISESVAALKLTVDSPRKAPAANPSKDCVDDSDDHKPDKPAEDL